MSPCCPGLLPKDSETAPHPVTKALTVGNARAPGPYSRVHSDWSVFMTTCQVLHILILTLGSCSNSYAQQYAVLYANAWSSGVERKSTLHCALTSVFPKIWGNGCCAPSTVHMSCLLWSFINFGDIKKITYFLILFGLKYLHTILVTVACTYGVIGRQSRPSYEPVSIPRQARNLWISGRVPTLHPISSSYT